MTLADDLKGIALEAFGVGVGAAIKEFRERDPDDATKAAAVAQTVDQLLEMMPIEQLREYLTPEAAARAEDALVAALARRQAG